MLVTSITSSTVFVHTWMKELSGIYIDIRRTYFIYRSLALVHRLIKRTRVINETLLRALVLCRYGESWTPTPATAWPQPRLYQLEIRAASGVRPGNTPP